MSRERSPADVSKCTPFLPPDFERFSEVYDRLCKVPEGWLIKTVWVYICGFYCIGWRECRSESAVDTVRFFIRGFAFIKVREPPSVMAVFEPSAVAVLGLY